MKIDLKFVRFDFKYRVESNFSDAGFVRFDSNRKFMIRLIRKVKIIQKINQFKIRWIRLDSASRVDFFV